MVRLLTPWLMTPRLAMTGLVMTGLVGLVMTGLVGLVLVSAAGCGSSQGESPVTAGARLWAEGPVRWLMLPEEQRQFRTLRSNRQAIEFIEDFWRRRDPLPGQPENPFRTLFLERAEAADRLYPEGETPGSLTDRGRALILLGPPPVLRYRQRPAPTLEPTRSGRAEVRTTVVSLEVWEYGPQDLPPALIEMLLDDIRRSFVELTFVVEEAGTRLMDGEEALEAVRRAVVLRPGVWTDDGAAGRSDG